LSGAGVIPLDFYRVEIGALNEQARRLFGFSTQLESQVCRLLKSRKSLIVEI
jgi:hypothetical protein